MPSQHCFDCGAQRTYLLQPHMLKGPWKYAQLSSTFPIEDVFSSNEHTGSVLPMKLAIS
jgi:hypothetical protein